MSEIDPRRIEYVPLTELKGDPRNPKAHDVGTINGSIDRFGVLDLIVRDERTGYLISGHGRTKALTHMSSKGETAPDGVKVSEDGEWLVLRRGKKRFAGVRVAPAAMRGVLPFLSKIIRDS